MKHHVRGFLEENSPDTAIFHFRNNNLKNNENAEDIVKNEKKIVVVSGITVENDKFNDKGKNVNSLLKRKCEGEKIVSVDNSNITVNHAKLQWILE